ncbi:unnamed protein product [Ceutorhynchus assimilis]|uniref:Uncharacterized protein n=1 Tax=Ceutorhynchus assimilis TaxID=467358 RepID=A0A9N9MXC9_9CUCU|nr:unnamed protein product [Ceutorhynchus assimilis]
MMKLYQILQTYEIKLTQVVTEELFSLLNLPNDEAIEICDENKSENPNLEDLSWDALENLVGFIAFKPRKKEKLSYIPDCNEPSFSWIIHLSESAESKPFADSESSYQPSDNQERDDDNPADESDHDNPAGKR